MYDCSNMFGIATFNLVNQIYYRVTDLTNWVTTPK